MSKPRIVVAFILAVAVGGTVNCLLTDIFLLSLIFFLGQPCA